MNVRDEALLRRQLDVALTDIEWLKRRLSAAAGPAVGTDQQMGLGDVGLDDGDASPWYWGKLASAMTAGTLAAPTTTTVNVWVPDPESEDDPRPFIVTTDAAFLGLTVTNRANMSGSTGTMVKIERRTLDGYSEWSIKWADC